MKKIYLTLIFSLVAFFSISLDSFAAPATTEGREGMLELGSIAPDFTLPDAVSGQKVSLNNFKDKKALVVMMICRHCPFVQHVKTEIARIAKEYQNQSVAFVGISSNDISVYPEDAPESLKEMAVQEGYEFPILYDESQVVAKAYTAVATPDFFVFDRERKLVYRGQMDDSRPGNELPVTGEDLRTAIDAILHDSSVLGKQKAAVGCSIKWKKGNEPAYL